MLRVMEAKSISKKLLAWYHRHRRDLPWRAAPGTLGKLYEVWLSEIMLQQTTVVTVQPYFRHFMAKWPDVTALATAKQDDVLAAWAGLGYYARARNLHACARAIVEKHDGIFPDTEAGLLALPGIGPYTAAAVAAIAFGHKTSPVDGNIERVVARLFAIHDPLPGAKVKLRQLAATLTPAKNAGDFAQAMMDLGATICTPRRPRCDICPLSDKCLAYAQDCAAELPGRAKKLKRPVRHGVAFILSRRDGALLLRRRPERGLLGGMIEVPSTPWRTEEWELTEALALAPAPADWDLLPGIVDHVFTHFHLKLQVAVASHHGRRKLDGDWYAPKDLMSVALPSAMRKICRHAGIE